ncbi:unnamed protein product [Rhizophagus irregularis]|nr:unnamed protein product [Rhizophagus irregularis]
MDDSNDNQNTIINQNKKKCGRPKTDIWDYFKEGPRNRGHCSAECNFCGWKQQVGQPIEMQGHIALNCLKVSPEVKSLFLEKVKNNGHLGYNKKIKISHNQPKIDEIFDSTKIDQAKIEMANRAIVKFFACCGYNPPCRQTLTEDMLNAEISHVITEINLKLNNEKNLTLASHRAGAELTDEIKENMVKGGKLKGYCQTRWMTACDCVSSVLRCEEALKNVGKGFRNQVCHKVVYWAIENIWIKMGGGENSSSKLIGQIAAFRDNLPSYNDEFVPKYYTVERCERIFSVMGWYMNKRRTRLSVNHLQNLTKLHTYYVSNAKTELKYTARDMNVKNDEEFYQLVRNELDNEDGDYGDTEDELVDIEEYEKFGHKSNDSILQSENYFNFVSKELVELLKLQEPRVVIEPVNVDHIVDHGNENFDIEKLLDQQFSEDDDVNV